jgi:hypothetical protein
MLAKYLRFKKTLIGSKTSTILMAFVAIVAVFACALLSACRSYGDDLIIHTDQPPTTTPATQTSPPFSGTPIPSREPPASTGVPAPDDVVFTPGGVAYRANVHQQGEPDKWPSIQSDSATLGSGADILTVTYRPPIDTKAGTTRNDIIDVYKQDTHLLNNKLELFSGSLPDVIDVFIGGGGGLMGEMRVVMVIEVNANVALGKYTFQIGITLDGKDYGTIPCRINVIE